MIAVRLWLALLVLLATLPGCPCPRCPEPTTPPTQQVPEPQPSAAADSELGVRRVALSHVVATGDETVEPLTIHVLDVGQGDCAIVQCPNGDNIVIDCGSSARGAGRERIRERFDQILGAGGTVDVLVITHPDADHINYLVDVIGQRTIERALLALDEGAYTTSVTGQAMIAWLGARLQASNAQPEYLSANYHDTEGQPNGHFSCGDTSVYVLAASVPGSSRSDSSWTRNTASVVLLFDREVGGQRFRALMTGDGTLDTEEAIRGWYSAGFLDVDVLKIGHHGSETSTSDGWLQATTPRYAFTTAGHHGSYHLPRCSVTNRVLDAGIEPYAGCHALECGQPPEGDNCGDGSPDGWCDYASTYGLYNSDESGELTFRFDGELSVSVERGQGGCE